MIPAKVRRQSDLPKHEWTPLGGGTILSTVRDGLKWQRGLISGDVVGQSAADQIFARHVEIREGKVWYGYGWMIIRSPSRGHIYAHSGATSSHNFYSQYLKDHGLFIVTASNRIDGVYEDKKQ